MERIKVLKIDILSLFKLLLIVGGIGGIILGFINGLLLTPATYTLSVNGEVSQNVVSSHSFFSGLIGTIFGTFIMGISCAIGLTLLALIFNFILKIMGGITLFIHRDID